MCLLIEWMSKWIYIIISHLPSFPRTLTEYLGYAVCIANKTFSLASMIVQSNEKRQCEELTSELNIQGKE